MQALLKLYDTIKSRKGGNPEESYTAKLFSKGRGKIAQKVGEEAVETVIAAVSSDKEKIVAESADLLYHLCVLWADSDISLEDVETALKSREGVSGIEEKKNRKK